jgi:subtilase family serine protease
VIKVRRLGDQTNVMFAILMLAVVFLAQPCSAQERRSLQGQVPKPVANGTVRPLGRYPGTAHLDIAIGLPLSDQAGLKSFIDTLYDPNSPTYRNFLTPDQFTKRFGVSAGSSSQSGLCRRCLL